MGPHIYQAEKCSCKPEVNTAERGMPTEYHTAATAVYNTSSNAQDSSSNLRVTAAFVDNTLFHSVTRKI